MASRRAKSLSGFVMEMSCAARLLHEAKQNPVLESHAAAQLDPTHDAGLAPLLVIFAAARICDVAVDTCSH
jgi:hypothetical protein